MIRTQIQLTDQQQAALRELSASTGKSMAELVRDGIERVISSHPQPTREEQIERAVSVAGRFSSGASDGSANHDRHLVTAFR